MKDRLWRVRTELAVQVSASDDGGWSRVAEADMERSWGILEEF